MILPIIRLARKELLYIFPFRDEETETKKVLSDSPRVTQLIRMQATWYLIFSSFCHFISLQPICLMCFSSLNFLPSKYCKYSPSISVGDSHGMIFLGINCLPLLNELNNRKNKYRFNLFYYQWILQSRARE